MNDNTVDVIYDFSRNVATLHQDEVKSSAFAKNQITLHPIPMYFLDPVSKCIMRETLVITSDDITHDSQAVSAFRKAAVKHLIEKRSVSLKNLIEWSDGCESQYKGVYAFKGTFEHAKLLGIRITSCFFRSEHGKEESDGETGVVKTKLQEFILGSGAVVKTATDIKVFGEQKLSGTSLSHFKHIGHTIKTQRTFIVVNDIKRQIRAHAYYPIAGTRVKLHCMETTSDTSAAKFRNLACFCQVCHNGDPGKCINAEIVQAWQLRKFVIKNCILFILRQMHISFL